MGRPRAITSAILRESREFADTKETLLHILNGLWRSLTARYQSISAMKGISSPRLRNALFALFIAAIFAYGAAFAAYMLTRFNLFNLIRDVNYDDGFYYFQIAYNLAEGKFSTFDGGITRTNGYHPLWLFLITPFYWALDKEAALFAIKAFEIMLIAGGVALIAVAARLARLPWILLFALLPTLYGIHALIIGLEAALALCMLGALFLSLMLYARNPARWKWLLAAVAFALPWMRLEYIAISLAATGALCLMELSWRDKPFGASWRELMHTLSRLQALPSLFAAGAGILVYFAYNQLVFGGVIPVNAVTKRAWAQTWWNEEGGYSLTRSFQNLLQLEVFGYGAPVALAICACFLIIWWFARRSRSRDDWLALVFLLCVFSLAAGHLAKFAQTVLLGHPYRGNHVWYFVPAYLMMALMIPVGCYVVIYFVRRFIAPYWRIVANVSSVGIFVAGAALLLANVSFTEPFKWVDQKSKRTSQEWESTTYLGVQVMNRLLPEDSVIGSWDAGVIGYFSQYPVVNLDGLVNSYDYFRRYAHRQEGYEEGPNEFGITHYANIMHSDAYIDRTLFKSVGWRSPRSGVVRRFGLILAKPLESVEFDSASWFWEQMQPHFHYESDGVGLIVDGRQAQAFAQDCEPDELVVCSWGGQADGSIAAAWQQAQTGLCTAAVMLPRDAVLPIRVEAMLADDYIARLADNDASVIRSDFDVYLTENSLIYIKRQCAAAAADTAPQFFLHIDPLSRGDLPFHRKLHGYDKLDFDFNERGMMFGGGCMATVPLPDYDIAAIRTGQYVQVDGGYQHLWEGEINLDAAQPIRVDLARLVGNDAPAIRSDFDVYLIENRLIYLKEQCAMHDTAPTFFLHIDPIDVEDLPADRKQYGFDNLDFGFERHATFGDNCMATVPLPDYDIAAIRTGQHVRVNGGFQHLWEGEINLTE